jgi:tetratricopeptide (TPR) repeat protein
MRATIGRYRVVRQLGRGGMGEVYLAQDSALHRQVAVKVLTGTDTQSKRRFVREAIAASQLSHPNVAVVHEAGESDDGVAFIAMQYVEGESLAARLLRGKLPVEKAVQYATEIADALAEAHDHGIVHRDIKPSNIMIDTRGHAKVLDFGIAKTFDDRFASVDETTAEAMTAAGMFVGTLQYVSPEQAQARPLDGRSDIFSLGVVLYEMVSGQNPFVTASSAETIRRILNETPPPIPRADCPQPLQRIIFKCLEKDPAKRYATARELEHDLEEIGQPAKTRRTTHYAAIGAIAAASIATIAVLQWPRKAAALSQQDTILLADFANQTRDPVFDRTLRDALAIELGQSPYLNLFPDSRVRETLKYMNRGADTRLTPPIAREICQRNGLKAFLAGSIAPLGSKYVVTLEADRGDTGDTLARAQVEARNKEDVLRALDSAASDFRRKVGESVQSVKRFDAPIEQATTSSLDALQAFALGDEKFVAGKFEDGILQYRHAVDLDPQFALAYSRLGALYHNVLEYQKAAEARAKAFELRSRTTERERFYIEQGYFQEVTGELDKGLESTRLWTETYPREWRAHGNLAYCYGKLGNQEQCLKEAREAIALNPRAAPAYEIATGALMDLNRAAEARATLRQALAVNSDLGMIHFCAVRIAAVENKEREIEQEIAWAEKSAEGGWIYWALGHLQFARGQPARAGETFRRLIDLTGNHEVAINQRAANLLGNALLGRCSAVKPTAEQISLSSGNFEAAWRAGTALALCGRRADAESIAVSVTRSRPKDTLMNSVCAPLIRGAAALESGRSAEAAEVLRSAAGHLSSNADYLPNVIRGWAYLAQHDGRGALADFNVVLNHVYVCKSLPVYPLAQLGAARAAALLGDRALSRQRYQEFFQSWKDAEPDLPALVAAKQEFKAVAQ